MGTETAQRLRLLRAGLEDEPLDLDTPDDVDYLYSFDDDFDVLDGVTRLNTAENPYR